MTLTTVYQDVGSAWQGVSYNANYYQTIQACYSRTTAQASANKSTIWIRVVAYNDRTAEYTATGTWIGTFTGFKTTSWSVYATAKGGSLTTLWENSYEVTHNADGTYSTTLGAKNVDAPVPGSVATTIAAKTLTLPTIPRYATFTKHKVNSTTEHTVKIEWSTDVQCKKVEYSLNSAAYVSVSTAKASSGTYTISGLKPGTAYKVKTRVTRNDSGLTTVSGEVTGTTKDCVAYYKVSGAWKAAVPYYKVNGAWKKCIPYFKVNGAWKEGIH